MLEELKAPGSGVEVPGVSFIVPGFGAAEPIGSGGFSRVYRAHQPDLGRDVALKVLHLDLSTAAQRTAFERECRAMGALAHHPSIVSVFTSTFSEDGRPCIVMEYFDGGTFGDRLKQFGALDLTAVLRAGVELAGALQTAHDHGVVHRDIKPSNLFVSAFGTAVLGDFGISSLDDERTITGAGGLTVHYAPPELIEGDPATPASDIYSLAASLFTLLTGDKPYPRGPGQTTADLARRILIEPTPQLVVAGAPASLVSLLEEAMSKRPDLRPPSAGAFGQRLQAIEFELGRNPTPLIAAGFESVPDDLTGRRSTSTPGPPVGVAPSSRSSVRLGHRRLTAAALGGVALVALGSTAAAMRGDGGSDSAPATTSSSGESSAASDPFFAAPTVPEGVSVVADSSGGIAVSWSPDPSGVATGYQVEHIGSGAVMESNDTRIVVDRHDGDPACFVVRAVGEGGRLSADTSPVCAAD